MNKLTIYKASAGSGKTHTLTQEYLLLAFADVDNYRKILAVTFTNKAAEEMKMRIIEELKNLAIKGEEAAHYLAIKKRYPHLTKSEIIERARKIRTRILHNYTFFAVSTIDSFVQRVVRSFSFELGLHGGYAIQLDTSSVIEYLTKHLYEKIGTDKQIKKWLLQFAQYKIDDGKSWDFRDEVNTLANQIFTEQFHQLEESTSLDKQKLQAFYDALSKVKSEFETEMKELAKQAKKILHSINFQPKALGKKMDVLAAFLTKKIADSSDTKNYIPSKMIWDALEGAENWHTKTAKANVLDPIYTIYDSLNAVLNAVIDNYEKNYTIYLSAKMVLINFNAFGLLNDLAEALPDYRDENNALLISDTNLLLKKIIGDNDAPFIYEKVGSYYHHILIDEFQDTSGFQWINFRPLVQNALAAGKANLIVGDVKQSIYRWRGGDWKLLLNQVKTDIGKEQVEEETLDTNWRSKKNVLDFNNRIFYEAPRILQAQFNNSIQEEFGNLEVKDLDESSYESILVDAYADSYQLLPKISEKEGGRVVTHFIQKDGRTNNWMEQVEEILPHSIDDLLKNQHYAPRDIAVLVRRNSEGKKVVDMLLKYQNETVGAKSYDIISAESLYIQASQPVRLLVSALRYISDKNEKIFLHTLIYEYQQILGKEKLTNHDIFKTDDKDAFLFNYLPDKFLKKLSVFEDLSLYELTEELIAIFSLHNRIEDYPYIRAFQDAVLDYTQHSGSALTSFLEWWDTDGSKISIQLSDKQDAVQVLTVHKSKGLAFKVVMIPFCSWPLDHVSMQAPFIWTQNPTKPFDMFKFIPIKYSSKLKETFFYKDYLDEKLYAAMDALNMLYVAFTRPKEEMHIIAPYKSDGKISSIGDLLYASIHKGTQPMVDALKHDFVSFEAFWDEEDQMLDLNADYQTVAIKKSDDSENHFILDGYPATRWQDKLQIVNNSREFFIESIEDVKKKVDYGKLMHRILSSVYLLDDLEEALQDFYNQGLINAVERLEMRQILRDSIQNTEAKLWFEPGPAIYNEASLLSEEGHTKIPDRVVVFEDRVVVIDFKFGQHHTDYIQQVKEYVMLWKQMGYNNVEGVLFYVLDKKIIKV